MEITTQSSFAKIPKGATFNFNKKVNVVTGLNGTGKTSFLMSLISAIMGKKLDNHWVNPSPNRTIELSIDDIEPFKDKEVRYFLSEANLKHRSDISHSDFKLQLSAMKSSSGNSVLGQVSDAMKSDCFVILDEPETSLDLRSLLLLASLFPCKRKGSITLVTHNKLLLDYINAMPNKSRQFIDITTGKPIDLVDYYKLIERDLNAQLKKQFSNVRPIEIKPESFNFSL